MWSLSWKALSAVSGFRPQEEEIGGSPLLYQKKVRGFRWCACEWREEGGQRGKGKGTRSQHETSEGSTVSLLLGKGLCVQRAKWGNSRCLGCFPIVEMTPPSMTGADLVWDCPTHPLYLVHVLSSPSLWVLLIMNALIKWDADCWVTYWISFRQYEDYFE